MRVPPRGHLLAVGDLRGGDTVSRRHYTSFPPANEKLRAEALTGFPPPASREFSRPVNAAPLDHFKAPSG
jgi:hypothetical protein